MKARYFPLAHGKYDVVAGLKPLGTDLGNGVRDGQLFQFDDDFARYRDVKLAGRSENLEKYYPPVAAGDAAVSRPIALWMAERLVAEHPDAFALTRSAEGYRFLARKHATELAFDPEFALTTEGYRDSFDAISSQLQEDTAILRRDPADPSREWLSAIHLFFPNHWAARDKIGKPFNAVHAPVAGFEKIARAKDGIVDMMVTKGPFVRFAWGVATDTRLNHHPLNAERGRAFDPARPELHVRVERQTLTSFPALQASLFTIRTYFLDVARDLSADEKRALGAAIESMTPEQLVYKGLKDTKAPVLDWLRSR